MQAGRLDQKSRLYLLANALGSTALAVEAAYYRQWGFLLLEGAWAIISVLGIVSAALSAGKDLDWPGSADGHVPGEGVSSDHSWSAGMRESIGDLPAESVRPADRQSETSRTIETSATIGTTGSTTMLAGRSVGVSRQAPAAEKLALSRCPVSGRGAPAPAQQAQVSADTASQADTASEAVNFFAKGRPSAESRGRLRTGSMRYARRSRRPAATGRPKTSCCGCAKIAWRNTPRCVGKFYSKGLAIRDMRHLTTVDEVFAAIVDHLRSAFNGGRVKLMLTVFAPQEPGRGGIRIWNSQLVRYAGHRQPDGTVIGDPDNADFTDALRRLGWDGGTGGRFDPLPVVIQMPGEQPRIYPLPAEVVAEVPGRATLTTAGSLTSG